ncbi:pyruvate, phosphate dikinase [Bavariicoccus seileri]|uniref:pyruvate, phosphate dikinase n=1 Tax=Bavariicoccus seileri TaxID=549685 RepID=UPI0003B42163|nr:pyruvate, phosphate dikinase [Bavariicoccus seileri]
MEAIVKAKKFVYEFSEGNKSQATLLGGKGANLAEMTRLGIQIPEGFTITTEASIQFYQEGKQLWDALKEQIENALIDLERKTGKSFDDPKKPLLVSVRSGAAISMPGMMDTVLNLGLTTESVKGLAVQTGNPAFAYDSYRRFIQMFADVVKGVPRVFFERELEQVKAVHQLEFDYQLTAPQLMDLVTTYQKIYQRETGEAFPQVPREQLYQAVEAVFRSWNNERAILYRELHHIPDDLGTAVNVQRMVFGNLGNDSGTGVAFTRNPSTGDKELLGEFLINAQGEDVVAGIRTPRPIKDLERLDSSSYHQFLEIARTLENHYEDMQDIEFTIESGKLYLLQTRSGKRTAAAAIKIAVDLVHEGKITKEVAIKRIDTKQLDQLLHPTFDPTAIQQAAQLGKGLGASPGAASGKVYFDAERVASAKHEGIKAILVRKETSAEDLAGMVSSEGILTARGGLTSHAAVVARGIGKCCVVGCSAATIDEEAKTLSFGNQVIHEGDVISIDGASGNVYRGRISKTKAQLTEDYDTFMTWVNDLKTLKVKANADTPKDVLQALQLGAEGVGLCRTEHMFFQKDRIKSMRKMILSHSVSERQVYLNELLEMQRQDFFEMFVALNGKSMTIRLLDPPLHEFLPRDPEEIQTIATEMGQSLTDFEHYMDSLAEVNPMLGHRGVRLGITYPEVSRMQARAIIEGAILAGKEMGKKVEPQIMVPLVGIVSELSYIKKEIEAEIADVFLERGEEIIYKIGTMIEVPRAAITADTIAKEADFFSFGTNDLTQMGFGFSRDDAGKFLQEYEDKNLLSPNPFHTIDVEGIGKLVEMAVQLGRSVKPNIELGVCGEHGGDPESINFFHKLGLEYVSCSPFRVPIARLAAAKAVLAKV